MLIFFLKIVPTLSYTEIGFVCFLSVLYYQYYYHYYHFVYYLHIVVPCNTTKECQIWNDGTYCAEGFENIKHTNKTCYCAMMSKQNRKTGACIGELRDIFGSLFAE